MTTTTNSEELPPATIAGTPIHAFFHACAFVRGHDEERAIVAPFLLEGLRQGEKTLYIVDDARKDELSSDLERAGASARDRQLAIATWLETYLAEAEFSPQKMLATVESVMRESISQGYRRMRIVGQMGWAFQVAREGGAPCDVARLVEYEVLVNDVLARTKNPAICVYDVEQLSGTMMMDLLRAHPLTVVHGVLYQNPFFTPPPQMLEEIRGRAPS